MDGQQTMERYLDKTMYENNEQQKETVNGRMRSVRIGCSYEDTSITLGFPVQEWQANRGGDARRNDLHGLRYYSGSNREILCR